MPTSQLASVAAKHDGTNFGFDNQSVELIKGDKLSIWSAVDMEYNGDLEFELNLELSKGNKVVYAGKMDPRMVDSKRKESTTVNGNKIAHSFIGRNAGFTISEDGNYTLKSFLSVIGNGDLRLNKYDLILKLN